MKKRKKTLRALIPDAAIVLGAVLVVAGAGIAWPPLGIMMAGGVLIAGALLGGEDG